MNGPTSDVPRGPEMTRMDIEDGPNNRSKSFFAPTRCQSGALVAFLDLQPDAIVPVSTLPAIAAKRETTKIPIVTATGSDPVRLGVVPVMLDRVVISLAARSAKGSEGVIGFRWKPSRCLHHRQRRERLHSGLTW